VDCEVKPCTVAAGRVPASPRLRFDTVSRRWLGRFEAKVEAGERPVGILSYG
jgi:hypothetical protein